MGKTMSLESLSVKSPPQLTHLPVFLIVLLYV